MSIRDRIKSIVAEQLGIPVEGIEDDAHLVTSLGADELDCVELLVIFEEEFGKPVPDGDVGRLTTVNEIEEYLRNTLGIPDEDEKNENSVAPDESPGV